MVAASEIKHDQVGLHGIEGRVALDVARDDPCYQALRELRLCELEWRARREHPAGTPGGS